ncbi:MAG TPA: hypothetical protein VFC86_03890, partial [Planctomycetota bacterium]|nr:hypothetical protein [Planctomycetota bacterium]
DKAAADKAAAEKAEAPKPAAPPAAAPAVEAPPAEKAAPKETLKNADTGAYQLFEERYAEVIKEVRSALLRR